MIITRGGKAYEPSNDPAIIAPKQKDMSHAAFVLWETMIGLILERQQYIAKFDRVEQLYSKAEDNPDHPNIGKVYSRIQSLQSEMLAHQRAFLDYEEIARREWRGMREVDREDEGVTGMYNFNDEELPPLWTHPLGESSPPAPFPISTTALQLASPALIRVYQGGKR